MQNIFTNLSAVLSITLGACTISDVGEVDYRRADSVDPSTEPSPEKVIEEREVPCRSRDGICQKEKVEVYARYWPKELQRRDLPSSVATLGPIQANQLFSVRLRTVYIGEHNIPESIFSDLGTSSAARGETLKALQNGAGKANMEIAVVANAFQLERENSGTFDFKPDSLTDARVVYFSDDVFGGQFLNMNNMLIYGPTTFKGGGLGLTLGIVEIDAENQRQLELVERLASFGGKAFPSIAPVVSVLNSVGSSLFEVGNTDDILFRYDQALDAADGATALNYSRLEEGNYGNVEALFGKRQRNAAPKTLTGTRDQSDRFAHVYTSNHSARTSSFSIRVCGVPSNTISPWPMT